MSAPDDMDIDVSGYDADESFLDLESDPDEPEMDLDAPPSPPADISGLESLSSVPFDASQSFDASHAEDTPTFNIFQALLNHIEVVYELARHLDADAFINLYSLSRRFHNLVNDKFVTSIERNALTNARESAGIFQFQCYRDLCLYDPQLAVNAALEGKRYQARDVPSFRWLRMVIYREWTVSSIMIAMAEAGHMLPANMSLVLKKIWFLMDMPDNARRIGTIHNEQLWSNDDLLMATMFFIKLDMRCTDPMDGGMRPVVRKLLMAQPSLSTTEAALHRTQLRDMYDFTQLYVEWRMRVMQNPTNDKSLFGMPVHEAGRLQYEGRVADPSRPLLLRPDQLVMKEGIRRDLRLDRWYLDMLLWGYIDEDTGEDVYPPSVRKAKWEREHRAKEQVEIEK